MKLYTKAKESLHEGDDGVAHGRATNPRWFTHTGHEAPRTEREDHDPLRILLADDDLEMRRYLAHGLRRDGYEVIEAKNGAELVNAVADHLLHPVRRSAVDLVISDQCMPGLTGLEVLDCVRGEDWTTPFILITAFGGDELVNEALTVGATAIFNKPFEIDDLRTAIVNLIGRPTPYARP